MLKTVAPHLKLLRNRNYLGGYELCFTILKFEPYYQFYLVNLQILQFGKADDNSQFGAVR